MSPYSSVCVLQVNKKYLVSECWRQRWKNVQACKQCLCNIFPSSGNIFAKFYAVLSWTHFCRKLHTFLDKIFLAQTLFVWKKCISPCLAEGRVSKSKEGNVHWRDILRTLLSSIDLRPSYLFQKITPAPFGNTIKYNHKTIHIRNEYRFRLCMCFQFSKDLNSSYIDLNL